MAGCSRRRRRPRTPRTPAFRFAQSPAPNRSGLTRCRMGRAGCTSAPMGRKWPRSVAAPRSRRSSAGDRARDELFRAPHVANHATVIAYRPTRVCWPSGPRTARCCSGMPAPACRRRHALRVSTGDVAGISFSPDGTAMAVASWDGSTTLWDVRSGAQIGSSFPAGPTSSPCPYSSRRPAADRVPLRRGAVADGRRQLGAVRLPGGGPGHDSGRVPPDPARSPLHARLPLTPAP